MKIEKIEGVSVNVKNLDEAVKLFSDILGITFVDFTDVPAEKTVTEHADRPFEQAKTGKGGGMKVALDRAGYMMLIEMDPPLEKEGLRTLRFKVPNLEQAKAEMKRKGIRLLAEAKVGGMREAIFSHDDLHGIRLVFQEYEAPTLVDAVLQK
ncbi:VOC family protein [Chloroflexota bacterium]